MNVVQANYFDGHSTRVRSVALSVAEGDLVIAGEDIDVRVAFVVLAAVAYKWGLPWAAARGAEHLPPVIGKTLSTQALKA